MRSDQINAGSSSQAIILNSYQEANCLLKRPADPKKMWAEVSALFCLVENDVPLL